MTATEALIDRDRQDLVTRQVIDESRLIRFVAGPDGSVVPDLARKLPGRGMWVEANRASIDAAVKKNLFARSAKMPLKPAPDLSDLVEGLIFKRCLQQLGLARREGVLISGFEKTAASIRGGRAAWIIEAQDGSADGRGKILALAKHASPAPQICGVFGADDLSLALGLENAIHGVLLKGGRAERWTLEVERLAGFRPLYPESWNHTGPGNRTKDDRGLTPEQEPKAFDGRGAVS